MKHLLIQAIPLHTLAASIINQPPNFLRGTGFVSFFPVPLFFNLQLYIIVKLLTVFAFFPLFW